MVCCKLTYLPPFFSISYFTHYHSLLGLRPETGSLPVALQQLAEDCWSDDARLRPSFAEIIVRLRRTSQLKIEESIPDPIASTVYGTPFTEQQFSLETFTGLDTTMSIN